MVLSSHGFRFWVLLGCLCPALHSGSELTVYEMLQPVSFRLSKNDLVAILCFDYEFDDAVWYAVWCCHNEKGLAYGKCGLLAWDGGSLHHRAVGGFGRFGCAL